MTISIGTFIPGLRPSVIDRSKHSLVKAFELKANNLTVSELTGAKIDRIFNKTYLIPKAGVSRKCIVVRDLVLKDFKSPLTRSSFQDLGQAKEAIADARHVVNGMSKSKARSSLSWQLRGFEFRVDNAIRFWKQEASTIQSQAMVSGADAAHLALAKLWLGNLAEDAGSTQEQAADALGSTVGGEKWVFDEALYSLGNSPRAA